MADGHLIESIDWFLYGPSKHSRGEGEIPKRKRREEVGEENVDGTVSSEHQTTEGMKAEGKERDRERKGGREKLLERERDSGIPGSPELI